MPEENTVDYASLCEELSSSGGEEKLYKWMLGETKTGTHCPQCLERAGKVKTVAE